jgi:hypothetical protein
VRTTYTSRVLRFQQAHVLYCPPKVLENSPVVSLNGPALCFFTIDAMDMHKPLLLQPLGQDTAYHVAKTNEPQIVSGKETLRKSRHVLFSQAFPEYPGEH